MKTNSGQTRANARFNEERNTFLRLGTVEQLKDYVKEGKRVKYTVTRERDAGFERFEISDPENAGALVMRGMTVRPGVVAFTFSKEYWEEPPIPDGPRTPLGFREHIRTMP